MDEETATAYLIGIRLREPLMAEDYLLTDLELHVGDFGVVETGGSPSVGQVKRPRRPLPDFKKDRLYRRVVRAATPAEAEEWRQRRLRELRGVETSQRLARSRGLQIKVVDVAIENKLREAMKSGVPKPLTTKDLLAAMSGVKPSTREWFSTARNYALYSNQGGAYDDILKHLKM